MPKMLEFFAPLSLFGKGRFSTLLIAKEDDGHHLDDRGSQNSLPKEFQQRERQGTASVHEKGSSAALKGVNIDISHRPLIEMTAHSAARHVLLPPRGVLPFILPSSAFARWNYEEGPHSTWKRGLPQPENR